MRRAVSAVAGHREKMSLKRDPVQPLNVGRYESAHAHMLLSTNKQQMMLRRINAYAAEDSLDQFSVRGGSAGAGE